MEHSHSHLTLTEYFCALPFEKAYDHTLILVSVVEISCCMVSDMTKRCDETEVCEKRKRKMIKSLKL